jgi:hypothetical protein
MEFPLFFLYGASFDTTVGGSASVGTANAVLDAMVDNSRIVIGVQSHCFNKMIRVTENGMLVS